MQIDERTRWCWGRLIGGARATSRRTNCWCRLLSCKWKQFLLPHEWVSSSNNGVEEAVSRPSREAMIRVIPEAFRLVRYATGGPFIMVAIASDASIYCAPATFWGQRSGFLEV